VIKPVPGSITNSLGMIFAPVPATKVMMCVHETRCGEFSQFLKLTSGKEYDGLFRYPLWGWEDHPAFCTWDEAKSFCDWLSQKEKKKYRLPTDEEWSHAVGLGSKEKRRPDTTPKDLSGKIKGQYPWGNQWPPTSASGNYMDMSHEAGSPYSQKVFHADLRYLVSKVDDGFKSSAPVMSFSPNPLGIYDLGGNASEWCEDWYDAERTNRVTRGQDYSGSQAIYDSGRAAMLSSWRDPGIYPAYGFRVVMEVP
jgi:formylglycine-generating enzyme required for sulfatase activity